MPNGSSKAVENYAASVWPPGTEVIGKFDFPGSDADVSACDVISIIYFVLGNL